MSGWRLLLTRPDEECAALAASLGEAGVHSSSLPLLAIDPLEETPEQRTLMLDLDRYCAVVVVSKPAARLGLERLDRYWPQPPQQTWCSVGAATAAILEAYGLDVTYPEQGDDSEALLALPAFQDSLRVHDPKVLIMRGEGGRNSSPSACAAKACRWTTCHSTGAGLRTIRPESCWQGCGRNA